MYVFKKYNYKYETRREAQRKQSEINDIPQHHASNYLFLLKQSCLRKKQLLINTFQRIFPAAYHKNVCS